MSIFFFSYSYQSFLHSNGFIMSEPHAKGGQMEM